MKAATVIDNALRRSGWVLAAGLAHALFTRDDAIAWADAWILRLDEPPDGLWDVSMPGPSGTQDVINSITAVVGEPSKADAFAIAVAAIHHAHLRGALPLTAATGRLAGVMRDHEDTLAREVTDEVLGIEYDAEVVADLRSGSRELCARFVAFARPYADAWADAMADLTAAR